MYKAPIFDVTKGTLLLPIEKQNVIRPQLESFAKAQEFFPKDEYHVTLIGFSQGKRLLEAVNALDSLVRSAVLEKLHKLINDASWDITFYHHYFHLTKEYEVWLENDSENATTEVRESYIELVDVPAATIFFNKLNELCNTDFKLPPLHVTLFTKGKNASMGIGVSSMKEFHSCNPQLLSVEEKVNRTAFSKIILPTRAQPDTLAAILLLKKYGEVLFPSIQHAVVEFIPFLSDGNDFDSYYKKGILLLDIGNGPFDHHKEKNGITLTDIVAEKLGVKEDPSLQKLFEYVRRDDTLGKGTISNDPLDRAFGLSGLLTAVNKTYAKNPSKVVDIVLPLLSSHVEEEERRTKEMPVEFQNKLKAGKAEVLQIKHRDKKLKVVIIDSDNPSMPGYLRSQIGGRFDVVTQYLPSGHVNVLTRPTKRVDLRSLVALVRAEDLMLSQPNDSIEPHYLAQPGRIDEVPHWYYDTATNSLQNGGIDPKDIQPTHISRLSFKKILELGLSEKLWSPLRRH